MSTIEKVFSKIHSRFNAEAAADLEIVFQFSVENQHYYLVVKNQTCQLMEGIHEEPSVVLTTDTETLDEILNGDINGMQAFMMGRIQATGDMLLASRLSELFSM